MSPLPLPPSKFSPFSEISPPLEKKEKKVEKKERKKIEEKVPVAIQENLQIILDCHFKQYRNRSPAMLQINKAVRSYFQLTDPPEKKEKTA